MASNIQTTIAAAQAVHDIEQGRVPSILTNQQEETKQEDDWFPQFGTITILTLGFAFTALTLNLLSIIFVSTTVVWIAGIVAVFLGVAVIKMQLEMEDTGGLRRVHNKLRENVNVLSQENTKLCGHVNDLVKNVKSLKHVEEELVGICEGNEEDVNLLVKLVKENGDIVEKTRKAIVAQAIAQTIDMFLDSDRDESSSLDEKEIRTLSYRLNMLEGIKVNEELFLKKAMEDPSMPGIMAILHTSMKEDVAPEDKVFSVFEDDEEDETGNN